MADGVDGMTLPEARCWRSSGVVGSRVGFVVEYCPGGREGAVVVVRLDRVTVEGPAAWRRRCWT